MRLAGRAQAAIEVLSEVILRHRPAAEALKDWGIAHRFAGSGDRAAIGNLVYDVLRRKSSIADRAGSEDPGPLVLAALHDSVEPADRCSRCAGVGPPWTSAAFSRSGFPAEWCTCLAIAPLDHRRLSAVARLRRSPVRSVRGAATRDDRSPRALPLTCGPIR